MGYEFKATLHTNIDPSDNGVRTSVENRLRDLFRRICNADREDPGCTGYSINTPARTYLDEPVRFIVFGRGLFPFDMLRHDRCYPRSSEDASLMASVENNCRSVELIGVSRRFITPGRWSSFGWHIEHDPDYPHDDGIRSLD